jgi:hypothetical protein
MSYTIFIPCGTNLLGIIPLRFNYLFWAAAFRFFITVPKKTRRDMDRAFAR